MMIHDNTNIRAARLSAGIIPHPLLERSDSLRDAIPHCASASALHHAFRACGATGSAYTQRYMLEKLLAFFFPDTCVGCGRTGSALCAVCERNITTRPEAMPGNMGALFDYRHPMVKKAIIGLKYRSRKALAEYFGVALYREFFKHLSRDPRKAAEGIMLVPIPAHVEGLRRRGYNHAELIARTISACAAKDGFTMPVELLLERNKETIHQVATKTKRQRLESQVGAFSARNGTRIAGKTVILIDDVITTGATIRAAKDALRPLGPKRILAVAAAH